MCSVAYLSLRSPQSAAYEVCAGAYNVSIASVCVLPCVSVSVSKTRPMFPRYLQHLLMNLRQTFVIRASWHRDELIRYWCQKVKGQGHIIAVEASSTQRCRPVQLSGFVMSLCTILC